MTIFNAPHILVGVDGSESSRAAAEWAAAEANRRSVSIRLVHAYVAPVDLYPGPGILAPDLRKVARSWAQNMLSDFARRLGELFPGLSVQTALHYGPAVTVLADESGRAVLTAVGAHGAHRFSDAILGSVASRMAARAKSPLVVVRPGYDTAEPTGGGRIVVGVDDSPHAQAAIGFAFEEAAIHGTDLLAIHSWDDQPIVRAMAALPVPLNLESISEGERRMLAEQLSGWVDKYPDVAVRQIVETGRPTERLIAHCSTEPDAPTAMVVVGSRGRGGFAGMLLGSTSAQLIAHAPCPVAVVRDLAARE